MNSQLTLPVFGVLDQTHEPGILARTIYRIVERVDAYRRYHRTRSQLEALSDHELSDIGLERSDIERIARR